MKELKKKIILEAIHTQIEGKGTAHITSYKNGIRVERVIRSVNNCIVEKHGIKLKMYEIRSVLNSLTGVKTVSVTADSRKFKATFFPRGIIEESKKWGI